MTSRKVKQYEHMETVKWFNDAKATASSTVRVARTFLCIFLHSEQMVEVITASAPAPTLLLRFSRDLEASRYSNSRGRRRRCCRRLASGRVLPPHPRIRRRRSEERRVGKRCRRGV